MFGIPPIFGAVPGGSLADGWFVTKMEGALAKVEHLLGATRLPVVPTHRVRHTYDNKFELVEAQVSAACAAVLLALQNLGVEGALLAQVKAWAQSDHGVALRLSGSIRCVYDSQLLVPGEPSGTRVEKTEVTQGDVAQVTEKTTTTRVLEDRVEHVWNITAAWQVDIVRGGGAGDSVVPLLARTSRGSVRTTVKTAPVSDTHVSVDAPLAWLLRLLDDTGAVAFAVDRAGEKCATPRRNPQVEGVLQHGAQLIAWVAQARAYFELMLVISLSMSPCAASLDRNLWSGDSILAPCVFFKAQGSTEVVEDDVQEPAQAGALLDAESANALLLDAGRSLSTRLAYIDAALPAANATDAAILLSATEGKAMLVLDYVRIAMEHMGLGVDHVEAMLRAAMVAAIGREVMPQDFDDYMRRHIRRVVSPDAVPQPLCLSVRRSVEHAPEGSVRLVARRPDAAAELHGDCLAAHAVHAGGDNVLTLRLSADTTVELRGDLTLHAWVQHAFLGQEPELSLVASARQFSCYVMVLGRMASATAIDPVAAVIVRDKAELRVPLRMAAIPSPGEFASAVAGLSPEQRTFAEAMRWAQLQSTLFCVALVQVKPQLEELLGLKPEQLTREIALTQHVMELLVNYHVPVDVLRFAGAPDADGSTRLADVKGNVQTLRALVTAAGDGAIRERVQEAVHASPFLGGGGHRPSGACGFAASSGNLFGGPAAASTSIPLFGAPAAGQYSFGVAHSAAAAAPASVQTMWGVAPAPRATGAGAHATPRVGAQQGVAAASDAPAPVFVLDGQDDDVGAKQGGNFDIMAIPGRLDAACGRAEARGAVMRAAVLRLGPVWSGVMPTSVLDKAPATQALDRADQDAARRAAFDLLDALSRGGAVPLRHAAVHVLVGTTVSFEDSLMDTVIQRNINPIDRAERATLALLEAVHTRPVAQLVAPQHAARLGVLG
jgi:hypothetical protein